MASCDETAKRAAVKDFYNCKLFKILDDLEACKVSKTALEINKLG